MVNTNMSNAELLDFDASQNDSAHFSTIMALQMDLSKPLKKFRYVWRETHWMML